MKKDSNMKGYCTYLRVSTQRQGAQGLGISAQREMCKRFIEQNNGAHMKEFMDVESGTHRDRKGLWQAIDYCKNNNCSLVIAKLDRLARDVEFTFKVINTGIDIHFTDMPVVNSMILGVFASVAQYEREMISKRTKDALAAKKSRGEALGGSSNKWRETYNAMPKDERKKVNMKRGASKNSRYLESKDVTTFLRVLKKTFPFACENEEAAMWDWSQINTKGENKVKIISYMRDFKEIDGSGMLFAKWDFTQTQESLRVKVASFIQHTRRALTYKTREAELTNTYINN